MTEHTGPLIDRVADFEVIDCAACGFRHVLPLPTLAEQISSYREQYFTQANPGYFERNQADREWHDAVLGDRYHAFAALLGEEPGKTLIDIGCGAGNFLEVGRELGWRVFGLEPSPHAVAHARERGLEVREGFCTREDTADLGQFDVVHLSNVLEHVADPLAVLAAAAPLVRPGGLLCVGVPNDYNPLQETARDSGDVPPWWLAPPHHLNYFDFASLENLLRRVGATPLRRTTSFPMELFLLMGDIYVGNAALGSACHGKRKRFDMILEQTGRAQVRRDIYQALASAGLGREAIVIARMGGAPD